MQRLPFQRVSLDEYRIQLEQIAIEVEETVASTPAPPPKRPVGRPKRALDANAALAASAIDTDERPTKKQRGKYTDWFSSPYITDILCEYTRCDHRPAKTVDRLKARYQDGRFDRLSHSSLLGWFDKDHQLLPRFQAHLDSGLENVRQNGRPSAFEDMPHVEEEIKSTLLKMRAAGTAMNSHIVRWVMQGVIELRTTSIEEGTRLNALKLGQSYISAWMRKTLKMSWRKATTAASKLPLDWEEQGLQMSMRIAATMELKKVRALAQVPECTCASSLGIFFSVNVC